jgi:hypothetical protein
MRSSTPLPQLLSRAGGRRRPMPRPTLSDQLRHPLTQPGKEIGTPGKQFQSHRIAKRTPAETAIRRKVSVDPPIEIGRERRGHADHRHFHDPVANFAVQEQIIRGRCKLAAPGARIVESPAPDELRQRHLRRTGLQAQFAKLVLVEDDPDRMCALARFCGAAGSRFYGNRKRWRRGIALAWSNLGDNRALKTDKFDHGCQLVRRRRQLIQHLTMLGRHRSLVKAVGRAADLINHPREL